MHDCYDIYLTITKLNYRVLYISFIEAVKLSVVIYNLLNRSGVNISGVFVKITLRTTKLL